MLRLLSVIDTIRLIL